MADIISYIVTSVVTFVTVWIVKNTQLKEGITNVFLKSLNKEGISKIPLQEHRVFLLIRTYKNQYASHMFNSEAKNIFYKEFLNIVLSELEVYLQLINSKTEKGIALDNIVLSELSNCIEKIEARVAGRLVPPNDKVRIEFTLWRQSLFASLSHSVDEIVSDDLVKSTYLKQYRTLDTVRTFLSYLLNSGAKTFSAFNGAFDTVAVTDVIKDS